MCVRVPRFQYIARPARQLSIGHVSIGFVGHRQKDPGHGRFDGQVIVVPAAFGQDLLERLALFQHFIDPQTGAFIESLLFLQHLEFRIHFAQLAFQCQHIQLQLNVLQQRNPVTFLHLLAGLDTLTSVTCARSPRRRRSWHRVA